MVVSSPHQVRWDSLVYLFRWGAWSACSIIALLYCTPDICTCIGSLLFSSFPLLPVSWLPHPVFTLSNQCHIPTPFDILLHSNMGKFYLDTHVPKDFEMLLKRLFLVEAILSMSLSWHCCVFLIIFLGGSFSLPTLGDFSTHIPVHGSASIIFISFIQIRSCFSYFNIIVCWTTVSFNGWPEKECLPGKYSL